MFQKFSEETIKIIKNAKLEMQKLKHPFVGSEHILLSILNTNLNVSKILNNYNITYSLFKNKLIEEIGIGNSLNSYFIYTPLLKRVLDNSILIAKEDDLIEITPEVLMLSILDEGEGVAIRLLKSMNIDLDKLYMEFENKEYVKKIKNKKKLLISEYGVDLTLKAKDSKIDPVVGRDMELERIIEILSRRTKNNPLLIGDAGVGKTAIIEYLAYKIYKKEVPDFLINKKIISLSMSSLISGTKYRGEFEDRMEKIIKEIENNSDLILFVDEIHLIVGAGGAEGAIDASNILKPYLARGKFKLIGATTLKEYKDSIEKDKALNRRFQTIIIKEPNLLETKNIIMKLLPIYEKYHNVKIKKDIIDDLINLSNKYILNRNNPDKTIDILDEACAKKSLIKDTKTKEIEFLKDEINKVSSLKNKNIIKNNYKEATILKEKELELEEKINKLSIKKNKKELTINDIIEVIKSKSNVPIYDINKKNINLLLNLSKTLKKNIIGQDNCIDDILVELRKKYLNLGDNNNPISFLFIGSSGVGKTKLSKLIAENLGMNLIRIDASEYKESHSISKIIGSPPGYVGYNEYSILDDVKNNPYSLILIDEIEKSCSSFLNLFLQILDEGFITNSNYEKVFFNNTIIIMTSNNTSKINPIGFNNKMNNNLDEYFNIEFINRINKIIKFNDLCKKDIEIIINNELKNVKNRFKSKKIVVKIQKNIVNDIISMSNYKEFGARKINKIIETKVNNIIIDNLLCNKKNIIIKDLV